MHPILFEIPIFGGLTIFTYGALVAFAFLMGIFWVSYEARRLGEDPSKALDLIFWIIVSAIIGSRIYYVVTVEPATILKDPLGLFKIWRGGLVFQGGVLFAMVTGFWWIKRHNLPLWKYVDIFTPAIPLGHFIGRMGCFMAGCCHGREAPAGSWYSVIFPNDPHSFAPGGVPLYPTQLMDGLGELAIFVALLLFRKHKSFNGQLMAIYMFSYAVVRFIVELFRQSDNRTLLFGWFSMAQLVSVLMILFGLVIWVRNRKREAVEA